MKKAEPLGVIIAAGETAYRAIRNIFPEDTETVIIKPCPYLEKDQCFVVQNRRFSIVDYKVKAPAYSVSENQV